jgi:hypothetical protein
MLDPANGDAFLAAANGLSKRIQRSNLKQSEAHDLYPVLQGLKTAQANGNSDDLHPVFRRKCQYVDE